MALEQKRFWMPRDHAGCLTNGEMAYNNSSRVEPKRGYQWFLDANGTELLSNKKQVTEAGNIRPTSGLSDKNVSAWDTNASSFQPIPGQFPNRLFGSELESSRTINLVDVNDSSVRNENMIMRKNPSVSLSMTHAGEPSSFLSFGGIRKVKVNEVRDSDSGMHVSVGHSYIRGDNGTITTGTNYSDSYFNTISLPPTYENTTFSRGDDHFSSMGHPYNKGEGHYIVMRQNYGNGDESNLSTGQPLYNGDSNFISIGQLFGKGPNSLMPMAPPSYSKAQENLISTGPAYNKGNGHFILMGSCYSKTSDDIISTGQTYGKMGLGKAPIGSTYDKEYSNAISFGGFHDEPEINPSAGITRNYDLLMRSQNMAQNSEEPGQKDLVESNVEPDTGSTSKSNLKADSATSSKNKEPKTPKKLPSNNFPANVKSLLSTGMLDGIRVKYVSWSREKNLHGIIKGAGYMCACNDCQLSKALNAYEFERHAGCKTKHPNNHIYFENGKTIYAVVQELKNTPQEELFDVIQNITGSPVNQKNFRIWKASFQAATLELQRIYGKEDFVVPC